MNKNICAAALSLALFNCGGDAGRAPIINKSPERVIPYEVTVANNDSIYAIAWKFGLDYADLAEWNRLHRPYKLRPGRKLKLRPTKTTRAPTTTKVKTPAPSPTPAPKSNSQLAAESPRVWHWPADGRVIRKFSRAQGHNGIRIAGVAGDTVRAAAAGEVVYAGDGLRGYGNLVIVKHSRSYLSAYAHNRKILVGEGVRVTARQPIARMGRGDAGRAMLHFEIRKQGRPVDPLRLLK